MSNVRIDARMALARYESSVAAFGMEAGFPMKDVRVVQEYIDQLEAALRDIIEQGEDDFPSPKDMCWTARKALEGFPEKSVYKEGYRAVEEAMGHPSPEFWVEKK